MIARRSLIAACLGGLAVMFFGRARSSNRVEIHVDPATSYQRIRGWEATAEVFWTAEQEPNRAEIYRRVIEEVGITRIRVETFSGAENTDHSFDRFRTHAIDMEGWRARRYATVNDNADPFQIDPAGFDFANLDWRIDQHLLPLQAAAKAIGRVLEVTFTYVAFTKQIRGGAYIHTNPEEYAEFILAAFLHMRDKYALVPDNFEPILEPDNIAQWTPVLMGQAIAAATRRLSHAGFTPRIIAPSVTNVKNALPWLDGIASVPGAMVGIRELSYHRYQGAWPVILQKLAARADADGIETSMLEFWGGRGTYATLHEDLKFANVSCWQGRTVLKCHKIDPTKPLGQQLSLIEDVRYNVQYYRHVRPGARRIGATSSAPAAIDPLAFVNEGGGFSVVVKAEASAPLSVTGLPAGRYQISYAVASGSVVLPDPVVIGAGEALLTEMPDKGVLTIAALA